MLSQDEVRERLRKLAEAAPRDSGVAAEIRLLDAFRARRDRKKRVWRYLAVAAAALVITAGAFLASSRGRRQNANVVADESGFIALPYAQSDVPLEHVVVVRVIIAPAQARALGVPFDARGRSEVSADLVIGQDGMARAVRFVP